MGKLKLGCGNTISTALRNKNSKKVKGKGKGNEGVIPTKADGRKDNTMQKSKDSLQNNKGTLNFDTLTTFQTNFNNDNNNHDAYDYEENENGYEEEEDDDNYSLPREYYDSASSVEDNDNEEGNDNHVGDAVTKVIEETINAYITECRKMSEVAQFNIMDYVEEELIKLQYFDYPEDCNEYINTTSGLTKKQFANNIMKSYNMHGIDLSSRTNVDDLIFQAFAGNSNLPFRLSRKRKRDGEKNGIPVYENYCLPKSKILCFDVCRNGCMVYVGVHAKLKACTVCKEERFYCKGNLKRQRGDHNPEDNNGGRSKCQINYRCFVPVVARLLHFDSFMNALNFHNEDICKDYYTDVTDGINAAGAIKDMKVVYDKYVKDLDDGEQIPIHVGLVLSFNWDGMQQFKTKSSVFWPTFLSIENLPPTFRKAIGAGTFLSSIFTKTQDSVIEDFILSNCLIPELDELLKGKLIKANEKTYLVQAR